MKTVLFGRSGQLGWELQRTLPPLGEIQVFDYPEIDLTQPECIRPIIQDIDPELIINATAYTAVDRAESEADLAFAINTLAPGVMAEEAVRTGAVLIHYSTDYVFDGIKGSAYQENDSPNPLGVYGESKLLGERAIAASGCAHFIFRTSWVYTLRRDSFVAKVLQWSRNQTRLRLVTDQVSGPTWARMLAEISTQAITVALSKDEPLSWIFDRSGVYHLAGSGWASRLEWGEAILKLDPRKHEQITEEILPAVTSEFPSPAKRPLFSALDSSRFEEVFRLRIPSWKETLRLAMDTGNV